jgi:hypothetical protein
MLALWSYGTHVIKDTRNEDDWIDKYNYILSLLF